MYAIGIDIGSTYTKYCVISENGDFECFSEQTPIRQKDFFTQKAKFFQDKYGDCTVVSCGYGRKNAGAFKTVSELTALAKGIDRCFPSAKTVLDIGGQDTKLICQDKGKIKSFFVNDKCAAGSGLFLGNVLSMLKVRFEELDLRGAELPINRLSSTCAVFAQSEIVNRIADGFSEEQIVKEVIVQILTSAKTLLGKTYCDETALSGGLTLIQGIAEFAEKVLCKRVIIPPHSAYLSAIGCAVCAAETYITGGKNEYT